MLDRRYLRGAKDMREAVARVLKDLDLHVAARVARNLTPNAVQQAMSADPTWTARMAKEDVEHQRAGWRERTAAYQTRKKSRGAVK
jgi:hypothetical protein